MAAVQELLCSLIPQVVAVAVAVMVQTSVGIVTLDIPVVMAAADLLDRTTVLHTEQEVAAEPVL